MENQIKIGVGVMIWKDGKVLMGRRKGSHGAGEYAFPGGHLEYMESFEDCARREVREEAGIEIKNIRFNCFTNVTSHKPKHYVHIGLVADWAAGEPEVREPDKLENWDWYLLENLPTPIFDFCLFGFDAYKTGKNFYDKK